MTVALLSMIVGFVVGYVIYQAAMWLLVPSHRCRHAVEVKHAAPHSVVMVGDTSDET